MTHSAFHRAVSSVLTVRRRIFWSLLDQALVSGSTVLTSVLIVRALGLADFGSFSLMLILVQSLSTAQVALVIAPMMTNYERREQVTKASYLAAVLVHQAVCLCIFLSLLLVCNSLFDSYTGRALWHLPTFTVALTIVSTQCQDLVRRFCFASERPGYALASDGIAYLGRLIALALLSSTYRLDLNAAWLAISLCNGIACLVLISDYVRLRISRREFGEITKAHSRLGGWLLGSAVTQWLSGNLYLIMIGALLGVEALGAVRTIQTVVGATNVLLQSLENFLPSAATREFVAGGKDGLLRYVRVMSVLGLLLFGTAIGVGVNFIDLIMETIYGRTFEHQASLFVCFGAFYGLGYIQAILVAALRSLSMLSEAFWFQTITSIGTLPAGWMMAGAWGALGAASALLLPRFAIVLRLWFVVSSSTRRP